MTSAGLVRGSAQLVRGASVADLHVDLELFEAVGQRLESCLVVLAVPELGSLGVGAAERVTSESFRTPSWWRWGSSRCRSSVAGERSSPTTACSSMISS
jgi:hypothetical protein